MGERWARITFIVTLFLGGTLLFWTVRPFFIPVLLGTILVVLTHPVHARMQRALPGRRRLAALLATLGIFFGVVGPLATLAALIVREVAAVLPDLTRFLEDLEKGRDATWAAKLDRFVPGRLFDLLPSPRETLAAIGSRASAFAGKLAGGAAAAAGTFVISGFLTFVTTYYLFLDGEALLARLLRVLPLENRYERELFREFRDTSIAVIYGTVVVGLVQGAMLFIAFVVTGVPSPLVWSALAFVMAFVPLLGSGAVWLPVGLAMLFAGEPWKGAFILAYGAFVVSTIDNFLRPLLVKGRLRVHPLIVFLTIFGGLATFGFIGFILGPIIGSLSMALLRIWERDWVDRQGRPRPQPNAPPPTPPAPIGPQQV